MAQDLNGAPSLGSQSGKKTETVASTSTGNSQKEPPVVKPAESKPVQPQTISRGWDCDEQLPTDSQRLKKQASKAAAAKKTEVPAQRFDLSELPRLEEQKRDEVLPKTPEKSQPGSLAEDKASNSSEQAQTAKGGLSQSPTKQSGGAEGAPVQAPKPVAQVIPSDKAIDEMFDQMKSKHMISVKGDIQIIQIRELIESEDKQKLSVQKIQDLIVLQLLVKGKDLLKKYYKKLLTHCNTLRIELVPDK